MRALTTKLKKSAVLATSISTAVLTALVVRGAFGDVNDFTGPGTSWDVASSWSLQNTPQPTDALLIDANSLNAGTVESLDASYTVQTLSFDTGAGILSLNASATAATNQTLTLTGGTNALATSDLIATSAATTGAINIGATSGTGTLNVALATSGNISVGGSSTLNFGANSVISGAFSLSQSGNGTLVLAGTNTFGGAGNSFTLNSGTLDLNNSAALGAAANTFVINGGTIDNTSGAPITIPNASTWGGNFAFGGTQSLTLGAVALTGTRTITVNRSGPSATLTVAGAVTGAAFGITKAGNGTLVFTGANTYTGPTVVSAGTLSYSGSGSYNGGSTLGVATGSGSATVNFASTGTFALGAVTLGSGTGAGAINQSSGSINANEGTGYIEIGNGAATAYGSYVLSGGTLNTTNTSGIRIGDVGMGIFTQTGGTMNLTRFFAIGASLGKGVATFTGGTATGDGTRGFLVGDSASATGIFNLGTQAGGNATIISTSTGGFQVTDGNVTTGFGTLNLNSGILRLTVGSIVKGSTNGSATATVNFNGGTVQAGANNLTLINNTLTRINIFNGGAVFDTQANSATASGNLLTTSGNGVYPAGGTLAIASGGTGYVGAPLVTVSGGSGSGVTAVANVSSGAITGVTLTSPGQNYTVGDVLTFTFAGGGASAPAGTFTYTLTAADVAANGAGGLTKLGTGTLTLSGTNTFTGPTNINAGTLTLGNALALQGSTLNYNGAGGALSFGTLTSATFGGLQGTQSLVLQNSSSTAVALTVGGNGTSTTYSGVLTGPGSLVKTGAGSLTLTGNNTYAGATTVNSGTLVLSGNAGLATSAITVKPGAIFDVSGLSSGTFGLVFGQTLAAGRASGFANDILGNLNSAGTIDVAGTGMLGTLTLGGDLTLSGGVVRFDLAPDTTVGNGINDLLNVGNLVLSGPTAVSVNAASGTLVNGTYTLFDYSGSLTGSLSNLVVIGPNSSRQTFALSTTGSSNGSVLLTVSGHSANLIWAGNGTTNPWDLSTTDFLNGGSADKFFNSDNVTFDDTGSNSPVVLISDNLQPGSITVNNSAHAYTFSGPGTISGGGGLTKNGNGTLTIATANSYTGATTITGGLINIGNASALGSGPIVFNGGSIDNTSGADIVFAANNPQTWNFDFTFGGTNSLNLGTGAVTLGGNIGVTVNANTLTVGGAISGPFGLLKAGNGTLTLNGANTFSGGLTISSGLVNIGNASALGTGTIVFNGGNIDNTSGAALTLTANNAQTWNADFTFLGSNALNLGTGAVTLGGDRSVTVSANTLTVGGPISGGFGLTKAGNGTLVLSGGDNYTGPTAINGGILRLGNGAAVPLASVITVASGATFDVNANNQGGRNVLIISGTGAAGQLGAIVNTNGAAEGSVGDVTLAGDASVGTSGGKLDFYGAITGPYTLTATAGNAVDVRTLNALSGLTGFVINTPVIVEASQSWSGPYTVNASGALGGFQSITISGAVTLNGGTLYANGNSGNTTTFAGPITVQTASTIGSTAITSGSTAGGNNVTVSGTISGPGAITFGGNKTTTLTATNAYTGGSTITGGIVVAGATDSLGTGGLLMKGGTFNLNGFDTTVANLSSTVTTAVIQNSASLPATLTVGSDNTSTTYTSTLIDGSGGALSLVKTGNGALTLSGANTYTGSTTVNAGTLAVSGSITSPATVNAGKLIVSGSLNGSVVVNGGVLGGNGTLTGDVSVGTGLGALSSAVVAPGGGNPSGPSQLLSINGMLSLANSDAAFQFRLDSGNVGNSDFLMVQGLLILSGEPVLTGFDLENTILPAGQQYLIAAAQGGIIGTFANVPQNGLLQVGNNMFTVDYTVNGGTEIAITSVPEPGSLVSLFGGCGMLLGLLRVRRRRM